MADEKKEWKGIEINSAEFQGKIVEDPVFNGEYAFLTLRTKYTHRDEDGQWLDTQQDVPIMVEPKGPINTVKNHIKKDRKLMAWCYYKSWDTEQGPQHRFVAVRFSLGDKPYEGPQTQTGNLPQPPV